MLTNRINSLLCSMVTSEVLLRVTKNFWICIKKTSPHSPANCVFNLTLHSHITCRIRTAYDFIADLLDDEGQPQETFAHYIEEPRRRAEEAERRVSTPFPYFQPFSGGKNWGKRRYFSYTISLRQCLLTYPTRLEVQLSMHRMQRKGSRTSSQPLTRGAINLLRWWTSLISRKCRHLHSGRSAESE